MLQQSGWTDDKVTELKRRLALGTDCPSYRVLAGMLGMSRNAISGKVFRLGLGNGRRPSAPRDPNAPRPRRPRKAKLKQPQFAKTPIPEITAPDTSFQCTLAQLGGVDLMQCRAPIGEVGTGEFRYCGAPGSLPGPYCPFHQKLFHVVTYKPRKSLSFDYRGVTVR